MTAPVPAGSTDAQAQLREEIARELNRHRWISRCRPETGVRCQCGCWRGSRGMAVQRHFADAVLALPAVRAALDAQEAVKRVEELHSPTNRGTGPQCQGCATHVTFTPWPCKTIAALRGDR